MGRVLGGVETCVDREGVGECRSMCGWGRCWGSVRHVWMGRVLGV